MAESDPNIPARTHDDDGPKSLTCEFCRSVLSRRGEVLRMSTEAKAYSRLETERDAALEKLQVLQATIAQLNDDLTAARQAPPEPAPGRRGEPDWS